MNDVRGTFLKQVTDQIKAKEAKKAVSVELNHHIKEVKNTWIKKGLPELDAEKKAVEQMGSPIKLGQQLNKLHQPRVDWMMVSLLITVLCVGFLPLVPLGYVDEKHFLLSKMIFVVLGGVTALGLMLIDYRKLMKHGWLFYYIGMIILFGICFFPNSMVGGILAIRVSPLTIESMLAVPIFWLAWASFFHCNKLKIWQFAALFSMSFILFFEAGSITTTAIYSSMVYVMLCWSIGSRKNVLKITFISICIAIIAGFIFWFSLNTDQLERLLGFLNPEDHSSTAGYTYLHIKELISIAGWFGNTGNNEFIPGAHTDLVFVSLTYYFGWLFAFGLIIMLSFIFARMFFIIKKVHDHFGNLLIIGGMTLFVVQVSYNIGMTLGLFPIIAVSLPFISYGFMPVMLNSIIIGVILSVYRRKDFSSVNSLI
ncbi:MULTISPECIES: FtsW/RodA/SpoVE family cell cycle protein [Metabacillus]|uniref:FtsW/RodA/SpoVE family cell cycle protein n=1 Tax=Metabacillus TaxID=2675233 RepID=UPI000A5B4EF5|nr:MULTISPECIES: FtsW/RodA/SpoVE family cell cycle protein [Metabacillus]